MSETTEAPGGAAAAPSTPAPQPRQDPPRQRYQEHEDPPRQDTPRRTPADQIAELRAEAAQYRISARDARQERDDAMEEARRARENLEAAKTSAVTPLQQKLEKAMARQRDSAIEYEMVKLGLQDTDLVYLASKMPDAPKVEIDDEFDVKGAAEFAAAFKKWKPEYFKKADASAPPSGEKKEPPKRAAPPKTGDGGEPPPTEGDKPIDVRNMDKKTYAKYKADMMREFRRQDMR